MMKFRPLKLVIFLTHVALEDLGSLTGFLRYASLLV